MPNYRNLAGAVQGFGSGVMQGFELADRRRARNLQEQQMLNQNQNADRRMTLDEQQAQDLTDYRNQEIGLRQDEQTMRRPGIEAETAARQLQNQQATEAGQVNSIANSYYLAGLGANDASIAIVKKFIPWAKAAKIDQSNGNFVITGDKPDQYAELPFASYDKDGNIVGGIATHLPFFQKEMMQREKLDAKTANPKLSKEDVAAGLQDFDKYFDTTPYNAKTNPHGLRPRDYAAIADAQAKGVPYKQIAEELNLTPRVPGDPEAVRTAYQSAIDSTGTAWTQDGLSKRQAVLDEAHQTMKKGLSEIAAQRDAHDRDTATRTYKGITAAAAKPVRGQVEPLVDQGSMPAQQNWQPNPEDLRPDGTLKGNGWLGKLPLNLPGGKKGVATEYSVGVQIGGKEMDIPSLVPTLSKDEVDLMVNDIIPNHKNVPDSIVQKAVDFAKGRIAQGKSPFAENSESPSGITNASQGPQPASQPMPYPENDIPATEAWQKPFDSNQDGRINQADKAVILAIKAIETYDNQEDPVKKKMIEDKFGPLEMTRFRALKAAFEKKARGQAEKHVGLTR